MGNNHRLLASLLILLQVSVSCCTIVQVWERFWVLSCQFSSDIEKYLPPSGNHREKRSVEEINFEDPIELFNYLYPLADMGPEDLGKEEQRSSPTSEIYIWLMDLGHLWLSECRSRFGKETDETVDIDMEADSESVLDSLTTGEEVLRYGESGRAEDPVDSMKRDHGEINYRSGNLSRSKRSPSLSYSSVQNRTSSSRRSGSVHPPSLDRVSPALSRQNRRNTSMRSRPKNRKKPFKSSGFLGRREEMSDGNSSKIMVMESRVDDEDSTTTTAAPPPAEETFFAAYGGDIEYFFPLISFGIPFDGEITFLGFHGFKGLFPY